MLNWLSTNKNREQIIILQERRGTLLIEAINGENDRESAQSQIQEINRQIENLALLGNSSNSQVPAGGLRS